MNDKMSETFVMKTNDNISEKDTDFHDIQKQLLLELTQKFGSVLGHKKLCKSVAKMEKIGHKINCLTIESFEKSFQKLLSEMQSEIKTNELLNENNSKSNLIINETIDNIIDKQIKVKKINETIVEKTHDLYELKAEENVSKLMENVLNCSENELTFHAIRNQLKGSQII